MTLIRLLLWLYPSGFRAEYGSELLLLYRGRRARAGGAVAVLRLWLEAVADVFRVAVPLHADVLRQDARFALRALRRSPGFVLTVVGVAALGIGANTAAFTVLDVVLVRPLPYAAPDRLVRVWESPPGYPQMEASPATFRDWTALSTSFAAMAASTGVSANVAGRGEPVRLEGAAVTAALLPMLGARPLIGRIFGASDEDPASTGALLLSERIWRSDFGGDVGVLGTTVLLDGSPHVVVGVLPAEFGYPARDAGYWVPLRFDPVSFEDRDNNYLTVIARLADGVELDRARREMSRLMGSLEVEHPDSYERTGATVNLLQDEVSSRARLLLLALSGAALVVLLIACINLANLLLARGLMRGRELAVRASLGAGRDRLLRQLLTESIGLAVIGGIVGIVVAAVSLPLLSRLVPESLPIADTLAIDGRVLVFALAITLLTGIGFGALPAWKATRRIDAGVLRQRGDAAGRRGPRLRNVLVTVEVAASVALLIVAGLLVRALVDVQSVDPGFDARNVVTMRTWLPAPEYSETARRGEFYDRVLEEVLALPRVEAAAYSSFLPIAEGGGIWPVEVDGQVDAGDFATASLRFITPGWFETMRIPLLLGRDVRSNDTFDSPFVAVVSESFASRHWPGRDPIGQTFTFAFFERTVVGIAGDIAMRGLERESEPQVWVPYLQAPDGGVPRYAPKDLAIRTAGDPLAIVPAVREIVRRADPLQPVSDVRLLEDIVSGDTAPRRVQLRLVGAFSAIAFLLAAIGLHGLLSFSASRRGHEIGVRLALGANRRSILRLVARHAVLPAGIGIVAGVAAGLAAGRLMRGLLAGIPPADPSTFAAAVMLALAMAVAGAVQPAVRAARIDPVSAIRDG